jgi:A/G-specific adenine glycosylase
VLCRVFALKKADEKDLWEKAELLLDKQNPFDYNQAMMDVGALICKKREPRCSICPLAGICEGKHNPAAYPAPKLSKTTPVRKRVIVALRDDKGNYYLRRRDSRFLHGLYGFPEYGEGTDAIIYQRQRYSLKAAAVIGQVTQSYSHFTLQAKVHLLSIRADKKVTGFTRVTLKQMQDLPLSRMDAKILKLLMVNGDSH